MFSNLIAANSQVDSYDTRTASSYQGQHCLLSILYSKASYSIMALRYNLKFSSSNLTTDGSTRFPSFLKKKKKTELMFKCLMN